MYVVKCVLQLSNIVMRSRKRNTHSDFDSSITFRRLSCQRNLGSFMVPVRKSLDLHAGEDGEIITVDL